MGGRRGFLGLLGKRSDRETVLAAGDDALSDPYAELGFRASSEGARPAAAPARSVAAA